MSDPHDLLLTFSDFQSISGSVQLQPKSEILPWTVTYSFAQFQRNRVTIRTLLIGYLWLMKILQNPAGCCRPLECESANCTTTAQHYHEHAHVTVTKNTSYKRYFAHDSWKSCKILQTIGMWISQLHERAWNQVSRVSILDRLIEKRIHIIRSINRVEDQHLQFNS